MYKDKPLVSIDIFDTAVFRDVFTPKEVFQVIENKVQNNFYKLRVEAQAQAGRKNPNFNLIDIYKLLPSKFSMKDEILAEIQGTYANSKVLNFYNNNRDKCDFIFISDMYLPSSVLKMLLEHAGYKDPVVFVSCEEGCGKSTGKLFLKVQEKLGRKINLHIGDSIYADIEGAKKARIPKTKHIGSAIYCNNVVTPPLQNPKLRKILIDEELSNGSIEERIGYIFSPLVLAFTQYVLNKASDSQTIFFNARDSFLMYVVARWILKTKKKIKYCRFSRMSCLFANIKTNVPISHKDNATSFNFLKSRQVKSLQDFLNLFGLKGDKLQGILKKHKVELDSPLFFRRDKNLILEEAVLSLQQEIYKKVAIEKNNFLKYIERINLQDNDMFVDIGYQGTVQSIIKQATDINLDGEYIWTCRNLKQDGCVKNSYFSLNSRRLFVGGILEVLFTEPVGSVIGYDDLGRPLLHEDLKFRKEVSKELLRGVLKGCKELLKSSCELSAADCYDVILRYVDNPTVEEAEFNNQDLFENGSNEVDSIVMFDRNMLSQGKIKDCYQKSYWKSAFMVLLKNSQEFKHLAGMI